MKYSIGVDIGGTKCAVLLGSAQMALDPQKMILKRVEFPTETSKGPDPAVERICTEIQIILTENQLSAADIAGIGVSCGSPLDSRKGIILNPPNLYGWNYVPIKQILEDRFGIPAKLENDANACGVAEWKYGAARGYDNVIFMTFGTGMGAGLILDGRLYSGTSCSAGEAGHLRLAENGPIGYGKAGSFEGFCSGGGIAQLAKSRVLERIQRGEKPSFCPDISQLENLTAKSVAQAAEGGEELAQEIYAECGTYLGRGLSVLIDLINPEIIVLGSIFARSGHLLVPSMEKVLRQECLASSLDACKIVPAQLGEHIGDYAALSLGLLAAE